MGYFILSTLLICFVVGWLKWKISTLSLSYYIIKKGYTPPSDSETKACTAYVIRKMLHQKDQTEL